MKTSVVFPQREIGNDPGVIRDFVQAVEAMGYDCLHVSEHVLGPNPDRPGGTRAFNTFMDAFHEPLVLLGFVAGLAPRIELAIGILVLPQRPTALVAKQAAEVDVLSGGRLRLGVGMGKGDLEMEALGFDFGNRGRRIEEQVRVLRELWTKPLVTFRGQYHTIDDLGINPAPIQQPIPIWFGGSAPAVLRRMARIGDGWMLDQAYPSEAEPLLEKLRSHLEAEGRRPEDFGIDVHVKLSQHPRETWAQLVEDWRELGATYVGVETTGSDFRTSQEHLDAVHQFKDVALS